VSYLVPSTKITLEAALRDVASGSVKARVFAAQALGNLADQHVDPTAKRRIVEALVRALEDDKPEVRAEACSSLGTLDDSSVIPKLIRKLDDGVAIVRQHAAIALGTLPSPDGFEALALALREGPADLRFQAATSLAEIDPVKAYEPILAALGDRDPQVVAAAALSLGALGDARAIAPLVAHVDCVDPGARFDVAYALAELRDATGRGVLVNALADIDRAWDAVTALANLRDADALARALTEKKVPPEATVLAAGKLLAVAPDGPHDAAARRVLVAALGHRKGHIRALAVEQIGLARAAWARPNLDKLSRSGKGRDLVEAIARAYRQIDGEPLDAEEGDVPPDRTSGSGGAEPVEVP
jgi:HEAT repeat protein